MKSKKRVNRKKTTTQSKKANRSGKQSGRTVSKGRNSKGKTRKTKRPVQLVKKKSTNPKRKVISGVGKTKSIKGKRNTIPQSKKRPRFRSKVSGTYNEQYTLLFPKGMAESKKVVFLNNWNPSPLEKFMTLNKVMKRKGGFFLKVNSEQVDYKSGYRPPSNVWIKLMKTKDGSDFYSAVLSPFEMEVTPRNTKAFAVGVLENYYSNKKERVSEFKDQELETERYKIERQGKGFRDKTKIKDSGESGFDGKPMKIKGIVFHFLY